MYYLTLRNKREKLKRSKSDKCNSLGGREQHRNSLLTEITRVMRVF